MLVIDLSNVAHQVFGTLVQAPFFWLFLGFVVVVGLCRTPRVKGWLGERALSAWMRFRLSRDQYRVCDDVTLPTDRGSTQIDHIVVSPYGIFVVETKNMGGWIFGGQHQKKWTQSFPRKKVSFQNPLHQNYKHTQGVRGLECVDPETVHSVVAFVGGAKLKTGMPVNVVNGAGGLVRYIKQFSKPVLSDEQVAEIFRSLDSAR